MHPLPTVLRLDHLKQPIAGVSPTVTTAPVPTFLTKRPAMCFKQPHGFLVRDSRTLTDLTSGGFTFEMVPGSHAVALALKLAEMFGRFLAAPSAGQVSRPA
ncbi:hypothetical protein H257_15404 [Aphanomyces astaci]|uniref:Uncharacterized protein n=1 Tax=Aphanomyces astaci TaxID=112090 RepID=W4FQA2_APHAT|nr:hypothetical protein H257_15404 [Aphanomyces astaci]ETV68863.1 hypothetical protein H257_15404 [Aphanomyces astaci]|eukprot:XP_009841817.1 hypothetical protein H257_15404 [Aphanomyces astaci]